MYQNIEKSGNHSLMVLKEKKRYQKILYNKNQNYFNMINIRISLRKRKVHRRWSCWRICETAQWN